MVNTPANGTGVSISLHIAAKENINRTHQVANGMELQIVQIAFRYAGGGGCEVDIT